MASMALCTCNSAAVETAAVVPVAAVTVAAKLAHSYCCCCCCCNTAATIIAVIQQQLLQVSNCSSASQVVVAVAVVTVATVTGSRECQLSACASARHTRTSSSWYHSICVMRSSIAAAPSQSILCLRVVRVVSSTVAAGVKSS
jgi:hypothetical protein